MVIQCLLLGKLHTVLVGTILTEMYTVSDVVCDAIAIISIWITEHVCSVRAFLQGIAVFYLFTGLVATGRKGSTGAH